MTTTIILPVDVEVRPDDMPGATPGMLVVSPIWGGVDRPNVGGILVRNQREADRLEAAYRSGAAFESTTLKTDVDGNTYIEARSRVSGRHLNADLKKLGY